MEDKFARRNFMRRALGAVGATLSLYVPGIANDSRSKNESTKMSPIKSIKPLGFQWETSDPFLFCVHHEDDFPSGNASKAVIWAMISSSKTDFACTTAKQFPGFPAIRIEASKP
jgi:hypothetical protein